MKKIKIILAVILILAGLGGIMAKSYIAGLLLIAVGAVLIFLPKKKAATAAEAAKSAGLSGIFQIVDDAERVNCSNWVVLDVEATGLTPGKDRIIEIAAQKYHEGQLVDSLVSLVNPGIALPAEITKLTGITERDLRKAPAFAEIAPRLRDFIGDLPVVAHNAKFDAKFIWEESARAGVMLSINYIDTVRMAKWCLPPQPDYKLDTLISAFGLLDHAQEHRALSDVEACENLYMLCRSKKAGKV